MNNSIKNLIIAFALLFTISCVPVTQSNTAANFIPKTISFTDKIYNDIVGTILLYNQEQQNPPVTDLKSFDSLQLEFDIFGDESIYINAKLIHCDASWNKTSIGDLQFLDDYNQFLITNYQFSENTKAAYVHYKMSVPKPKISGNYLLVVYRENNQADLLFTRRFMVVERLIGIEATADIPKQVEKRNSGQEINVKISYDNIRTINPQQEFTVTIRQNYRWENAKADIKPSNDLTFEKTLDFMAFDNSNIFNGGNESRFIDLRSIALPGVNVAKITNDGNLIVANSLVFQRYTDPIYVRPINDDLNGRFFLSTTEIGADFLELDYIDTRIYIDLGGKIDYPLYLIGNFNAWKKNNQSQLVYDEKTNLYYFNNLMKQGFYNFNIESKDSSTGNFPFGNSFRLTENEYDIIVYQKIIGTNYDRIVGYTSFSSGRN